MSQHEPFSDRDIRFSSTEPESISAFLRDSIRLGNELDAVWTELVQIAEIGEGSRAKMIAIEYDRIGPERIAKGESSLIPQPGDHGSGWSTPRPLPTWISQAVRIVRDMEAAIVEADRNSASVPQVQIGGYHGFDATAHGLCLGVLEAASEGFRDVQKSQVAPVVALSARMHRERLMIQHLYGGDQRREMRFSDLRRELDMSQGTLKGHVVAAGIETPSVPAQAARFEFDPEEVVAVCKEVIRNGTSNGPALAKALLARYSKK